MMDNFSIAGQASACRKHSVRFFALTALGIALMLPVASQAAQPAPAGSAGAKENKVVIQVSDADSKKWNLALNNAKNVQDAYGKDKVSIEIVVYGPGIGMLKMDSEVGNRVNDAVANGITVMACENTMQAQKLTKKDMLDSAGYVTAGVVELMEKQKQGYAYVRP
ncbi:MAG: DsrE family protein [Pseudomonadota bacterium]